MGNADEIYLSVPKKKNQDSTFESLSLSELRNKNHSFLSQYSDESKVFLDYLALATWFTCTYSNPEEMSTFH